MNIWRSWLAKVFNSPCLHWSVHNQGGRPASPLKRWQDHPAPSICVILHLVIVSHNAPGICVFAQKESQTFWNAHPLLWSRFGQCLVSETLPLFPAPPFCEIQHQLKYELQNQLKYEIQKKAPIRNTKSAPIQNTTSAKIGSTKPAKMKSTKSAQGNSVNNMIWPRPLPWWPARACWTPKNQSFHFHPCPPGTHNHYQYHYLHRLQKKKLFCVLNYWDD